MNKSIPLDIENISRVLDKHSPDIKEINERGHASVAMLLRQEQGPPEVLFIIRAKHDEDPWSGNIGFPGGRLNHGGENAKEAAVRETREELDLDLDEASCLGQLDDLYGAIMPVLVSCYVYHVDSPAEFNLNHEIESTFWCPLPTLLEKNRHRQQTFLYRGKKRTHPVVELLDESQPKLWGITYRLTRNFFTLCGYNFGIQEFAQGE